jgi:hypothetical protein
MRSPGLQLHFDFLGFGASDAELELELELDGVDEALLELEDELDELEGFGLVAGLFVVVEDFAFPASFSASGFG